MYSHEVGAKTIVFSVVPFGVQCCKGLSYKRILYCYSGLKSGIEFLLEFTIRSASVLPPFWKKTDV
jgi:hypothetical protein